MRATTPGCCASAWRVWRRSLTDLQLPVHIVRGTPGGPAVISVDGFWNAGGLSLSHWPGNGTPPELRHDLSTGSALAFSRLPLERQRELAGPAEAIVNNHYDTDGVLALFAVRHPEQALPRAEAMLAAARSGDFYQAPNEAALIVDAIITGFVDPERSPVADELHGLADLERHDHATQVLLGCLAPILDGEVEPYRAVWEPVLARYRTDLADLATCARDDIAHLDLSIWTAPRGARSGGGDGARFDPSRHALFGTTTSDRVLVMAPGEVGTTYRLLVGTRSWFELVDRTPTPRPPVKPLAARLNELEGTGPGDAVAWRTQGALGASPELWFGTAELESFAEHNPALRPSQLPPVQVRRAVADAARAVLVLD